MPIASGGGGVQSSSQIVDGVILNADINAAAAIARTKLDFGAGLVDADIAAGAAIAKTKLSGVAASGANSDITSLANLSTPLSVAQGGTGIGSFTAHKLRVGNGTTTPTEITDTVAGKVLMSNGASADPSFQSIPGWTVVKKTSDESKANNATLADDAELKFSMLANTTYTIRMLISFASSSATPDLKFILAGPTVTQGGIVGWGDWTSLNVGTKTAFSFNTYASSAQSPAGTDFGTGILKMELIVTNQGSAGTFSFQWAQNTSNATNMTVQKASMLEYIAQ